MTGTNDYDKLREHERLLALMYVLRDRIIDSESILEHRELFNALTTELVGAKQIAQSGLISSD